MKIDVNNSATGVGIASKPVSKVYVFDKVKTFEKNSIWFSKTLDGLDLCKFDKAELEEKSGVYILVLDKEVVYVGQSSNIDRRWNEKYRNPQKTTSTNKRINNYIYEEVTKNDETIDLYVCYTDDCKNDEKILIGAFVPKLNK